MTIVERSMMFCGYVVAWLPSSLTLFVVRVSPVSVDSSI